MNISAWKNYAHVKGGTVTTVSDFVNNCKFGKWKKEIEKVRAVSDKKERQALKLKILPAVTPVGVFDHRNAAGLTEPSGFLCMDYDGVPDMEQKFRELTQDPYTYALARSASGTGFFQLVRIDNARPILDSFLGLEDYYLKNYGLIADPQCKNADRLRFVTHDPDLFYNDKGKVFKAYLPEKAKKKLQEIVFGSSDVEHVLQQLQDRNIDLTQSDYGRYLKIGFAFHAEYGETGREYFHSVARHSDKYDPANCDKQYNYIARSQRQGITMATFFYLAKEAGLQVRTRQTQEIAAVALQAKKGNRGPDSAIQILEEIHGLDITETQEIVTKVFNQPTSSQDLEGLTDIEQLELFLHANYNLKRNEITRFVENYGKPLETQDLNTIYIRAVKEVNEKLPYEKLERLINSDFTPDYNPILEYFDTHRGKNEKGLISQLAKTITSDTGTGTDYVKYFFTKWFVSIIASAHGLHSPLLLALTGGQGAGKTEFFRRLLPEELYTGYFAESKLDAGKDDAILMTQKLIILDDEMAGKSKQESKILKELTSKQYFTLREPYGKKNVTLKRLAVLCGTSNEMGLLSDPTGNRRIIPVNVLDIDHKAYNAIDKRGLLMEAYHLYQAGYDWQLNKADVALLNENTAEFEQVRTEYELISRFFAIPTPGSAGELKELLTATDIKDYIEGNTSQKISIWKLGTELKAMGFKQKGAKINKMPVRVYEVIVKQKEQSKAVLPTGQKDIFTQEEKVDDLPF